MHHHRHTQLLCQRSRCREVIGVRVGVDQVVDAQPVARGERQVLVDAAQLGVDQRCSAGLLAADQIEERQPPLATCSKIIDGLPSATSFTLVNANAACSSSQYLLTGATAEAGLPAFT
jgi:hypothetical protein